MPIVLSVPELQPGMRLYQSVCNEYTVLLPHGKILDQRDVDALRRRYPDLKILIADPLLDEMCEFQDSSKDRETARQATQTVSQAFAGVRKKLVGRTEIRSADILGLQRAAAQVLQFMKENPVTALLLEKTHSADTYIQEHSANVFYISMVVGNSIKQYIVEERERLSKSQQLERSYALNLAPLAMGCLLADVGMLNLQDIYNATGPLTPEQQERLRNHPVAGEKMLPPSLSAVARMVVRTHHENFNGSGYPYGMKGEKLHVFSRIVRAADAFDAATSPRVYKKAKTEARVLWEMTYGPMREHFDPVITKVFTAMVHPFPIGAKLKLSNGYTAVVVRQNSKAPFFPFIIIAFDDQNRRLGKEQLRPPIELSRDRQLKIVSCDGEDLSYIYTTSGIAPANPNNKDDGSEAFNYAYP
ncbi:MAG: hypothetical protein HJJLKODD_02926 [Phycisphaerae bacterium]|nr:hypothetical protein [Phycisphaerae bacterium]